LVFKSLSRKDQKRTEKSKHDLVWCYSCYVFCI